LKAPELCRGDVVLRPYAPQHDARTIAWLNGDELRGTFGLSHEVTAKAHREWVEAARDTFIWAIYTREEHCGNVLLHCKWKHQSAYFQIYIGDARSRSKGVGRQSLQAVLEHAFVSLRLHRVWLHTIPGNTLAERLYMSAGFAEEGLERESVLRNGRFQNQLRWSILSDEWEKRRETAQE
jgi:RimJ/RimL family protein N-acetyltransferase